MLVDNPCSNDSRVIKSAEAVATGGWRVTVICRYHPDLPMTEIRNGVAYQRVKPVPVSGIFRKGKWFSPGPVAALFPASRKWFFTRIVELKRGNDKVLVYLRFILIRAKFRSQGMHRVASALAVLALCSGYRFKSICARLWRLSIGCSKVVWRRLRRLSIGRGKPLASRLWRNLKLQLRPLWLFIHGFFERDKFGHAAAGYVETLRPDVVHAHDLSTLRTGAHIARMAGARLIYDSHELEMHRNATYSWSTKWCRRRLERKYIHSANVVITVSESIADHLRDAYSIKRPCVILNSPAFNDTEDPVRDVRAELVLGPETPLAVYIGGVTINRGLEQAIRSLVDASTLHFATVGPRRKTTEQELVEIARNIGVSDRVHFVDPVAPNEVVGYIRSADVSVLPMQNVCLNHNYCMPNKLFESVFAGLPMVVADLLEIRRFVETHGCGLIMDETDPASIARTLLSVIAHRDAYVIPSGERRELAGRYGWSRQADNLRGLYNELLFEPPRSTLEAV